MDFIDRIRQLSVQIPKQLEHLLTEEATKNALVMPFIQALGYNVFDPTEVVPEFTADVGVKRGEKVDYAILQDGKPIILIECKRAQTSLDIAHSSQLYRYFSVTEARFGILTNGVVYQFFTDLEEPNRMDERPFLIIDLINISDVQVEELKKFTKSVFDMDHILTTASELKYTREIKKVIAKQLVDPDDEMVRFLGGRVYSGRMTQAVREDFGGIVKRAFRQFINERISDRLQSALQDTQETQPVEAQEDEDEERDGERTIITSQGELDGYYIVKSILRETLDVSRVAMRDTLSYCGILLDDNNRKPICRLHFNTAQKYLGVFNAEKKEERIPIDRVDDIYKYADRIKAVMGFYGDQ